MIRIFLPLLTCCLIAAGEAQIVLFKLDDVSGVSVNYERVADFALKEGIKINFGVFGSALEKDPSALVAWIEKLKKTGSFEFWNHAYGGFGHAKENEGTGYEAQLKAINRSQELSKQYLCEGFMGFGPHAGAMDADTWKILNDHPEIKLVWGQKPPAGVTSNACLVDRKLNMENPTTKMNKAKFLEDYEKRGKDLEYISLQGHPNAWNDAMFEEFKDVALFLKGKGCRFMTMTEFLATRAKKEATPSPASAPKANTP